MKTKTTVLLAAFTAFAAAPAAFASFGAGLQLDAFIQPSAESILQRSGPPAKGAVSARSHSEGKQANAITGLHGLGNEVTSLVGKVREATVTDNASVRGRLGRPNGVWKG